MRSTVLTSIAAAGLVAFGRAHAQADQPPAQVAPEAAASGAAAREPDVVIRAKRAEMALRITGFVNQVTDFDLGDPARGLARWQVPVCPLVAGFPRNWAEYTLARVSDVGQAAGVPLAPEHCHPNLYILVSKQPQSLLQDLQKRHGLAVFGGAEPTVVSGFIAASRPVKTWYDTVERTPDGLPMLNMSFPGISQQQTVVSALGVVEQRPVAPNQPLGISTNSWSQASHLTFNVVWAIYQVFVIVDPTQFKGVSLGQLADYIAMAGLAQLRLDNRLGDIPTILTLFDKGPQNASPGMTEWDRALLKSIYSTEQKSVVQRSQIALDMTRTIAP